MDCGEETWNTSIVAERWFALWFVGCASSGSYVIEQDATDDTDDTDRFTCARRHRAKACLMFWGSALSPPHTAWASRDVRVKSRAPFNLMQFAVSVSSASSAFICSSSMWMPGQSQKYVPDE